jgi:F-box/leucine-rich repeat protein 10/11
VRPRRSPTPPALHVEPLSPSVSKLRALEPHFNYPATTNNVLGYGLQPQPHRQNVPLPTSARARAQSDYHRGHGRKPSNIDTLAEAALALSPGFVAPPFGYSRPNGQEYAQPIYPPSTEPPHKRARSAYFASPQLGQHASRPATSYEGNAWTNGAPASNATYESRLEEASLLLNFRTGGWPTPSARKMPPAYPPPNVRPHANSFPSDLYFQRPIEQVSRGVHPPQHVQPVQAPLLPPFNPQLQPSYYPSPNLPSPQRTSEGAGLSPRTMSDRRESDTIMSDVKPTFHPVSVPLSAQEPHQTRTPPEEAIVTPATNDAVMSESSEGPKKRGWPKGRPRAGAKKATTEKAPSKRATKANNKAAKARDVFVEVALEAQKDTRRRHSSSQTPAPDVLERAPHGPRAQSVPRDVPMVVREITPSRAARKHAKAMPETICASCKSTRESARQAGELDEWISCNGCKNWFHVDCAGFKKAIEVRDVDKYFCASCEPSHGKTTYVRKSARAHTSVDYAELQRGVLKTSEDSHEHHYIQPIKDGTFTFDPETFPRMRPELVTRDFFEKSGAFVEPICIPAAWNPRPWDVRKQAEAAGAVNGDSGSDPTTHAPGDLEMADPGDLEYDTVLDDGQDKLDMVMPEGLTVRQVANMVGPDYGLDVIDVKTQNSGAKMNLAKWADYYEEETDDKPIRNVISLEVSQTTLGRLLRRPKVVRDIDLQDEVWPQEETDKGKFPRVQFYCLMSVADSYTDFHIDFGGSSVYYHILKGKKTFFFIPPKPKHLKAYEEWNDSPQQNFTFLPHTTKECYRVDLHAGDTMLIPSGWIHAVWTPETSLVIGGNFLTRMSFKNQFKIVDIEKNNGTPQKFRYPHFQRIMWYTAIKYLRDDPIPQAVSHDFYEGEPFYRNIPIWEDFDGELSEMDERQGAQNARYYSQEEIEGLPDLVNFIFRTVMLVQGRIEGVSADRIKRVNASIPKGYGEPLEVAKTFALWVAWKRGNEDPPAWAHPDAILPTSKEEGEPKKLSARALKDMQRKEAMAAWKVAPDRQSKRVQEKAAKERPVTPSAPRNAEDATFVNDAQNFQFKGGAKSSSPSRNTANHPQFHQHPGQTSPQSFASSSAMMMSAYPGQFLSTPKTSVLGPKRVACDACRKRRIRCKHKDLVTQAPTPPPFSQQFAPGGATDGYFIPQSSEVGDNIIVSPLQVREQQMQSYHHGFAEQHTNGDLQSHTPNEVTANGPVQIDGPFDSPMPGTNAYVNANIPMAMNGVPMFGDVAKRGRSKACFECRKSKVSIPYFATHRHLAHVLIPNQRRCIHDESGNVDPVKAAETPIPRGSVASKKRTAEDGSPLDANKRLKPAEPGLSPAPAPMQGMHGILKPGGQHKSSRASGTPPKAPPEVYHKLPGQFYRPSSSDGNHEQQPEPNQPQRQLDLQQQPQHQPQHHNSQPNGSAPPIDPSLFSMYPEPTSNNAGPFSLPTNPYPMPDHSSADRTSLYAIPSLEQIATEVLDMNGGEEENGEAGLAAIQAFNRQRDGLFQVYQQQNGLLPMDVAPPVDGSVDSGVSMSGITGEKDGSSPPGFNVFSINSTVEAVAQDATQANARSPAMHHEMPQAHDPAPKLEEQAELHHSAQFEAHPEVHDTVESPPFADYQHGELDNRRTSFGGIPFYQPPSSTSPEMMRSMPHGFPFSSPNKAKRESFVATSPEMFRRNSREFSQPLEESDDVKMVRMLQQDEVLS